MCLFCAVLLPPCSFLNFHDMITYLFEYFLSIWPILPNKYLEFSKNHVIEIYRRVVCKYLRIRINIYGRVVFKKLRISEVGQFGFILFSNC